MELICKKCGNDDMWSYEHTDSVVDLQEDTMQFPIICQCGAVYTGFLTLILKEIVPEIE